MGREVIHGTVDQVLSVDPWGRVVSALILEPVITGEENLFAASAELPIGRLYQGVQRAGRIAGDVLRAEEVDPVDVHGALGMLLKTPGYIQIQRMARAAEEDGLDNVGAWVWGVGRGG